MLRCSQVQQSPKSTGLQHENARPDADASVRGRRLPLRSGCESVPPRDLIRVLLQKVRDGASDLVPFSFFNQLQLEAAEKNVSQTPVGHQKDLKVLLYVPFTLFCD